MGYKLTIYFTDGSSETVNEIFNTKRDALDEYDTWLENWGAGRDTLQLAGRGFVEADIDGYNITKV